jgi:hypothetical protein
VAEAMTLRFEDWYRYDIENDRQVVRLLGITGKGTYSAEFGTRDAAHMREQRKRFKDYVLECMADGIDPHEVEMEDEDSTVD